jgi:hypothetical protein
MQLKCDQKKYIELIRLILLTTICVAILYIYYEKSAYSTSVLLIYIGMIISLMQVMVFTWDYLKIIFRLIYLYFKIESSNTLFVMSIINVILFVIMLAFISKNPADAGKILVTLICLQIVFIIVRFIALVVCVSNKCVEEDKMNYVAKKIADRLDDI